MAASESTVLLTFDFSQDASYTFLHIRAIVENEEGFGDLTTSWIINADYSDFFHGRDHKDDVFLKHWYTANTQQGQAFEHSQSKQGYT